MGWTQLFIACSSIYMRCSIWGSHCAVSAWLQFDIFWMSDWQRHIYHGDHTAFCSVPRYAVQVTMPGGRNILSANIILLFWVFYEFHLFFLLSSTGNRRKGPKLNPFNPEAAPPSPLWVFSFHCLNSPLNHSLTCHCFSFADLPGT